MSSLVASAITPDTNNVDILVDAFKFNVSFSPLSGSGLSAFIIVGLPFFLVFFLSTNCQFSSFRPKGGWDRPPVPPSVVSVPTREALDCFEMQVSTVFLVLVVVPRVVFFTSASSALSLLMFLLTLFSLSSLFMFMIF